MKIDISTIFWLFFIIVALQPLLKKRLLLATRQKVLATLEKKRGSRVIVLIHRQETMSLLGFPILRYIDVDDSEAVIRAIHLTDPDMPLDLCCIPPGVWSWHLTRSPMPYESIGGRLRPLSRITQCPGVL